MSGLKRSRTVGPNTRDEFLSRKGHVQVTKKIMRTHTRLIPNLLKAMTTNKIDTMSCIKHFNNAGRTHVMLSGGGELDPLTDFELSLFFSIELTVASQK